MSTMVSTENFAAIGVTLSVNIIKYHYWVYRISDSLYYSSRKIWERCENSFVENNEKLCYLMRQITIEISWIYGQFHWLTYMLTSFQWLISKKQTNKTKQKQNKTELPPFPFFTPCAFTLSMQLFVCVYVLCGCGCVLCGYVCGGGGWCCVL